MTGAARILQRTRWSLRSLVWEHDAYLAIARLRYHDAVVNPSTDLVIDGFPRSASTFGVIAFQLAQDGHVRVAHHIHAPAHVAAATRLGVPVILPIREPQPTVVSCAFRWPYLTPRLALESYTRFCEALLPYRSQVVVAEFTQMTTDLGAVIGRVNDRFGTNFAPFEHSEQNLEQCFRLIEERASHPPWGDLTRRWLGGDLSLSEYRDAVDHWCKTKRRSPAPVREMAVARPSAERKTRSEQIYREYEAPELASLRAKAEAAYRALSAEEAS